MKFSVYLYCVDGVTCSSNLAISESKYDQLEKEVEILKQELLQARQAGNVG